LTKFKPYRLTRKKKIEHFFSMTLERRGFIRRVPGQARSITVIVPPESLPPLKGIQR
jgi:hypothetical protein